MTEQRKYLLLRIVDLGPKSPRTELDSRGRGSTTKEFGKEHVDVALDLAPHTRSGEERDPSIVVVAAKISLDDLVKWAPADANGGALRTPPGKEGAGLLDHGRCGDCRRRRRDAMPDALDVRVIPPDRVPIHHRTTSVVSTRRPVGRRWITSSLLASIIGVVDVLGCLGHGTGGPGGCGLSGSWAAGGESDDGTTRRTDDGSGSDNWSRRDDGRRCDDGGRSRGGGSVADGGGKDGENGSLRWSLTSSVGRGQDWWAARNNYDDS